MLCLERLELLKNGLVRMRLRNTDGTLAKIFEGKDAMAKLAMLVPAPNTNLTRYVGVFSAHHRWRDQVVPEPSQKEAPICGTVEPRPVRPERERRTWAELMRRAFMLDVLNCDCGGRRKVIAVIEDVKVVRRILEHLRLAAERAVFRPPRPPPASCA